MKRTLSIFAIGIAALQSANAQSTYTWSPGGIQDAGGTWDTSALNWNTGTVAWPNNTSPGDNAQFGLVTTTRTVTVSGTINASSLVFADLRDGFGSDWIFDGGTINLVGSGLINPVDGQNAVRINSVISGSVGLTLDSSGSRNGSAATILGGDNTYTGVTKVYDSTLTLYHANALGATGTGNGTEVYTNGRVLIGGVNGGSTALTIAESITMKSGAGATAIRSSNANNILDGNVVNEGSDNGLNVNTNHTFTVNGNITTDGGNNRRLSLGASGGSNSKLLVNGVISNGDTELTSLLIDGSGTGSNSGVVELAGNNTFSNGALIRRGTLLLSHANALGTSTAITFGDGGLGDSTNTLRLLTNGAYTFNQSISLNNAAGTNTYTAVIGGNSAHDSIFSGNITINDANAGTYQLTAAAGGSVNFSGVINDGAQTKAIGITGGGTVILSNNNTYDGATTIASGATLQLGNGSTTGALATTSAITNSGTLIFNRSDSLTQGTNFASTIGGTGALVKNGVGTLNLSGNNASTAGFTINQGAVYVTNNNALGASSNVVAMSGLNATELRLNANGLNVGNPINITASAGANGATLRNQVGESTLSGLITYKNTGSGRIDHAVIVAGGTTLNINGGVVADDASNAQISRMSFTSTGAVNFNSQVNNSTGGNNRQLAIQQYGETAVANWNSGSSGSTFSGGYEVARGTVNINTDNPFNATGVVIASGASAATSNILFQTTGAYAVGSNFQVNGNNSSGLTTIGGNHTSGTSTYSGNITLQASRDLRLTAASGGRVDFSGEITDGTNTGSLTKVGLGTVALTRAAGNSFDGGVTVSEGTMLVNNTTGSGTGIGAVGVSSGATLGGTGRISGAVNVTGVLSPGNSAGVLTINNNLTLNDTATFAVELSGTTVGDAYDRLVLGGTAPTLSLNGTNNLLLSLGFTPAVNDLFFIADVAGSNAISGVFEQLNGVSTTLSQGSIFTLGATQFQISYSGDLATSTFAGAGNDLALVVIPEPRAALLGGLGLLVLLRRRRG